MCSRVRKIFAALNALYFLAAVFWTVGSSREAVANSPYNLSNGHVIIPDWDYAATQRQETAKPLLELDPRSFITTATFHRNRIPLKSGVLRSLPFKVPEDATTVSILARAQDAEDVFPRIQVRLIPGDAGMPPLVVFEGHIASRSMHKVDVPLPVDAAGHGYAAEIEILNPRMTFDHRVLYFGSISFY